ncbi:MAG: FaeA/PapI family transcriptional regulator [Candidatus Pacearchaeota archaeon]
MKKSILNSSKKSAINRTNIKENIVNVVKNMNKPLSTQEIAEILKKSWHTIIRYCLELENEGKFTKFQVGRINVWQLKK